MYAKIGLNPKWGCDDKIWAEGSGTPIGTVLPLGLDCTGYVKWAFVNAGFEPNIIPRSGMSVNNFGVVKPKTIYFSSNSKEIDDLLPGDLLWCEGSRFCCHYIITSFCWCVCFNKS